MQEGTTLSSAMKQQYVAEPKPEGAATNIIEKVTAEHGQPGNAGNFGQPAWGPKLFEQYRLYIACEADEDIPINLKYVGENNLLIGSDYAHEDGRMDAQMVSKLRNRTDIPSRVADKILVENPHRFWPL